MKITAPPASRSFYYDRNLLTVTDNHSQLRIGVSWLTLGTYVVPANRRAILEVFAYHAHCTIAPAGLTSSAVAAQYRPLGVDTSDAMEFGFDFAAVGDQHQGDSNPRIWMKATDEIHFRVLTGDAVQENQFYLNYIISEFDA